MLVKYSEFVRSILNEVVETQLPKLPEVAQVILDRVANGGRFRIFASGHSHILSEELMSQTGGYDFCEPYITEDLFVHPLKSGFIERNYEFGEVFFDTMNLQKGDVLWLISNSGTNGVVVELAKKCHENDIYLVTQTNMKQTVKVSPRHPSGKKMYEFANVVINNCGEDGDAAFPTVGDKKQGPTSNIIGTFIFQALNVCFASILESSHCKEEDLKNGKYLVQKCIDHEFIQKNLQEYIQKYFDLYDEVIRSEFENIEKAALLSVNAVMNQKRNLMFGMVHDHSLVEEIHARAGTIMCNKSMVMQNTDIQFYEGVKKANQYAHIAKYADAILYSVEAQPGDSFFLVSQSSNEPAMKRLLQLLKERNHQIVLHTNVRRASKIDASVLELADIILDNHCPENELLLTIGDKQVAYPATSMGCFINQCYIMKMTQILYENGIDMPTRISINTDKGLVYTEELNRKFFNSTLI